LSSPGPGGRLVTVKVQERIAVITLQRPEALNALSGAMAEEIAHASRETGERDDVWVVVLTAAGDRAFCVGADLKERAAFSLDDFYANRRQIRGMFEAVRSIPQPKVAATFGYVLGGGLELALSCDLIVAAQGTQFGLPEVRVGLLPGGGGTQLLSRAVGPARAKELILRGRRFDASEGDGAGLIAVVVPHERLEDAAMELARDVCRSSPVAAREAKRAIDWGFGRPIQEALEIEDDAWGRVVTTQDRVEGIAAFNEKRDPRWVNR
jgi:enoyl-CoA hydratase/carnithine racemase